MNNEIQYLLIRNLTGIYGFPKGHVEQGETEEQTALREVFEEVGLAVKLVSGFRSEDEHPIPQKENTMKQIVYFLGEYSNQEFTYQIEELTDALLTDYETAMTLFQFDSSKRILTEANNFLLSR
jgi:NADH pyrophosphatase NudC (nudix superfamily)